MHKEDTESGVASQISCVTLARTVSQTKHETVREGKAGGHWASGRTKMTDREKASQGRTETVFHER